jgi:dihydrofolate reductase
VGKLIYLLNVSLDGFFESADHSPDFANVDDEIHGWFNDQVRTLDATLYGRRMYETMAAYWPYGEDDPEGTDTTREFSRIWKPMPKIVFSSTLDSVDHNARLVNGDVGEALEEVRREFDGDIGVGGPNLANQFARRGLVDEYRLVVHPVVLGAGTPLWPPLDEPLRLKLVETRTFASGVIAVSYAPAL